MSVENIQPADEVEPQLSEESRAKFGPDGSPLYFPGVTVLCHLHPEQAQDTIYRSTVDNCYDATQFSNYVQLPEASLHMTLLDTKVYHKWRSNSEEDRIPDMIRFREAFNALRSELQKDIPVKMTIDLNTARYPRPGGTLQVPVKPVSEEDAIKLRSIREKLSSAFNMSDPDHAYGFHITGYYSLRPLPEDRFLNLQGNWIQAVKCIAETVPSFDIDRIELCSFENMFHFQIEESVSKNSPV